MIKNPTILIVDFSSLKDSLNVDIKGQFKRLFKDKILIIKTNDAEYADIATKIINFDNLVLKVKKTEDKENEIKWDYLKDYNF